MSAATKNGKAAKKDKAPRVVTTEAHPHWMSELDVRRSVILSGSDMNADGLKLLALTRKLLAAARKFVEEYSPSEAAAILAVEGVPLTKEELADPENTEARLMKRWSHNLHHDVSGVLWPLEMFESTLAGELYNVPRG